MNKTKGIIRIGICKHTKREVLQIKDKYEDDAIDEKGWMCLHEDTIEEEQLSILNFKYKFKSNFLEQ